MGGSPPSEGDALSKDEHMESSTTTEKFHETVENAKLKSPTPKTLKPQYEMNNVLPTTLVNQLSSIDDVKATVEELIDCDGDSWICKPCGKRSSRKSDMRKHVEIHIEGLSFGCQLCGQTFRLRIKFNNHKTRDCPNK